MRANVATLALEKLIFIIWIKCKCFHNVPAYSVSAEDVEIHSICIVRHK